MRILLSLLLVPSSAFASWGDKGAPNRVQCKASVYRAKTEIGSAKKTIDELLAEADFEKLLQTSRKCPENDGKVVACDVGVERLPLAIRYYFNTQGGALSLEDKNSGLSTEAEWTNQYKLTESGYLNISAELTNTRGGLAGDKRIFRVIVNCYSPPSGWSN